jgi:phosphoglycolate phosphatase-like HAD superfamily hydrolase
MRIAFDMDGVLADMDRALTTLAEEMFGREAAGRKPTRRSRPAGPPNQHNANAAPASNRSGQPPASSDATPAEGQATPALGPAVEPLPDLDRLNLRQHTQLWKRVADTPDFWMKLDETEPGVVARLGRVAKDLHWEVLFITQRPSTAGQTVQTQTQRWLRKHGFDLPSVHTTRGSRGTIAAALSLDAVVDDRFENCLDVANQSRAWSINIARTATDLESLAVRARQMGIAVVPTVKDALTRLEAAQRSGPAQPEEASLLARLKQSFSVGKRPGRHSSR